MPSFPWRTPSWMATRLQITCAAPLDFYIKISTTDARLRLLCSQQRRRSFLKNTHTLTVEILQGNIWSYAAKPYMFYLKAHQELKRTLFPRGPGQREFHHERGRGTLRAIYVHVLLSYDAVTFLRKHSNRISSLNGVQRTLKGFFV